MSQEPQGKKGSSTVAIIALVCAFVCFPLGLILSIVALVKNKDAVGEAKTLSIIALVLNIVFVPMVGGILAAIAIPNFIMFKCRSQQSEAKVSLKSLYVAEQGYKMEKEAYSADLAAVQFTPMGSRYTVVVRDAGPTTFHAEATSTVADLHGDRWTIDQSGNPVNVVNGCQR